MKSFRRFFATVVLTFAVAFSTYAGEIPCGVTGTPPQSTSQATTTGGIETGVIGDIQTGVVNPTIDSLLSLLQSLLLVF